LSVNGKGMTAAQIGRQVGLSPREADNLLRELEDNGVIRRTDDGVIYSHRMVKDERLRNIRADAGRLGGNPNLVGGKVNQNDKQNLTPSSSSSSSSSNNTPKPPAAAPDGFAEFWQAYPKKAAKPAAEKAFRAAKLNGHLPEVIADVRTKASSDDWLKDGGKFIPNPATYLNQRRWEDEQPEVANQFAGAL
jgi:DNA-binding Lrp family transcriptional regulator